MRLWRGGLENPGIHFIFSAVSAISKQLMDQGQDEGIANPLENSLVHFFVV